MRDVKVHSELCRHWWVGMQNRSSACLVCAGAQSEALPLMVAGAFDQVWVVVLHDKVRQPTCCHICGLSNQSGQVFPTHYQSSATLTKLVVEEESDTDL